MTTWRRVLAVGVDDLARLAEVWPVVAEHARRDSATWDVDLERYVLGETESADRRAMRRVLWALLDLNRAVDGLEDRLVVAPVAELVAEPKSPPRTSCRACGSTKGPWRRGLCDRDRRRWERAGRPDIDEWLSHRLTADGTLELDERSA
jgi:hypothetical protein